MADVIDMPIQFIPRRRRRGDADQPIAADPNSIADGAVNEIRRGLEQGGANAALDRVAADGGAPARSADDSLFSAPSAADREVTNAPDLQPSVPGGHVDRDNAETHDFATGAQLRSPELGRSDFRPSTMVGRAIEREHRYNWPDPADRDGSDEYQDAAEAEESPERHADLTQHDDAAADEARQPARTADEFADPIDDHPSKPGEQIVDAADRPVASSPASQPRQQRMTRDQVELDQATRRSRWLKALHAFMGMASVGAAAAGVASGTPGLAALGAVMRSGRGSIEPNAPIEDAERAIGLRQQQAQAERALADRDEAQAQRDERLAFDREQAVISGKRADQAALINEGNMLSGQRNALARLEEQGRMDEMRRDQHDAEFSPQHQNAQGRRQLFLSSLEARSHRLPTLQEDFADVVENLPNMNANQIDAALDELKVVSDAGTRRGRGGGGGSRRSGDLTAPLTSPSLEALAQTMVQRQGIPIETARDAVMHMSDSQQGAGVSGVVGGISTQGNEAVGRADQNQQDAEHRVSGWDRDANAPRLSQSERTDARGAAAQWNTLDSYIRRMTALQRQIPAYQALGSSGTGKVNGAIAEAHQIQEQISSLLREIGRYGVPNGTELQRMEALAPRVDTVDGLMNAAEKYRALHRTLWTQISSRMAQFGYRRAR